MEALVFLFVIPIIALFVGIVVYFYYWAYQMIRKKTGYDGFPIVVLLLLFGIWGVVIGLLLPPKENKKTIL